MAGLLTRVSGATLALLCIHSVEMAYGAAIEIPGAPGLDKTDGRLIYDSPDGRFGYLLDGRIYLDGAVYNEDKNALSNGTELRSVRFGGKALLWSEWGVELDIEFKEDEVSVRDVWVAYGGWESSFLKIGQFKEPFSLEEVTSSAAIPFMERSLANEFHPGRNLGIEYRRWSERWQFAIGAFGEDVNDNDDGEGKDEGWGTSGRASLLLADNERGLLHIGAGYSYRTPDADDRSDEVRFRTRNETTVNQLEFLDTGRVRDVDHVLTFGGEVAAEFGGFSLQSEYIVSNIKRDAGREDADFSGGYVELGWRPFGGNREYVHQLGEFGRMLVGGLPVWEITARYSWIDLTDVDADILGGKGRNTSLGVSFYPNANIRIMLNLIHADNDRNADADGDAIGDDSFSFVQLRLQVTL